MTGLPELRKGKRKQTLLIITEHPPMSYRPAGERILHTALAGNSAFESVIVFSLRGVRKRDRQEKTGCEHPSETLLYAVKFARGMLYPLAALFDPIKFVVLFVYGFMLCRRYKPLCILSSMPPFETGASAWLLSKFGTSTLVIDLRDDWESAVRARFGRYFPSVIFNFIEKIASRVYSDAFVIFAATQTIANTVQGRGVATQTLLVPNGADTSVFIPRDESARKKIRMKYNFPLDKVIIVYCGTGTISYYRLDLIFSSLNSLPKQVKNKIYIIFYVYDGLSRLKRMLSKLRVADNILEIRNPLPRKSLAEALASCDVGLVPFDDKAYLLCARSTKLYEYLSCGLYVISSGPEGGELDAFFSVNPALGSFVRPDSENFALSFRYSLDSTENLFSDNFRKLRHSFIKRNHDRKSIMKTTMKALLERLQHNDTLNYKRTVIMDDDR